SLFVPILLAVAPALLPVVALPLLAAGAVLVAGALLGVRRNGGSEAPPPSAETRMFRIGQATGLAALIAGVLVVSHVAAHWLGPEAALATAFLTALAELQAATATVATLFRDGTIDPRQAQWAVAGLVAASSASKSVVAFASGGRKFGLRVGIRLMSASAVPVRRARMQQGWPRQGERHGFRCAHSALWPTPDIPAGVRNHPDAVRRGTGHRRHPARDAFRVLVLPRGGHRPVGQRLPLHRAP